VIRALEKVQPDKYVLEAVLLMAEPVVGDLPTLILTKKTARAEFLSHTIMDNKLDMKDLVEAVAPELVVLVALEVE
jgi:hypothetical protein